jgi:dihydroorotase
MNMEKRERGVGYLTLAVFGTLIAAGIFCAYHIFPFYYYYFELQNQMDSLVRVASVHTDKELRDKLRAHLKRMEIPATIDDVKIRRFGSSISMTLEYEEDFYVEFRGQEYDIHTFQFRAHAEGEYETGR